MIWRWLIFFSAFPFSALPLYSGTVAGKVELRDSRDPAVRNRGDYSGVVISLRPVNGTPAPAASATHAVIVQKNKTFSPHLLAITAGSVVDFPNADPIFHNAFSSYSGQIFDIGLYSPGSTRSVRFTREGVVRVFCNIHSSMSAMIVVLPNPYFAVTKANGSFEIPNVPEGAYELTVFHERAAESVLQALGRRLVVGLESLTLPVLPISEAGYLAIPHKNKYGRDYPPDPDTHTMYPGVRN